MSLNDTYTPFGGRDRPPERSGPRRKPEKGAPPKGAPPKRKPGSAPIRGYTRVITNRDGSTTTVHVSGHNRRLD